jgi:spore germination protein KB
MKENVSLWQLFILIFLFNMGSSLIKNLAADAENSGWIAMIVACLIGVCILSVYLLLLHLFPKENLFGIIEVCLGKWLSPVLSIIYISYFLFIAAFALRDFGELLVATIFEKTPLEFILISMILVITYILTLGIEVLGRSAEIFIPYFVLFFTFLGIGIIFSGELEIQNIFPILSDGVKPILKSIFPNLIYYPFSEIVAFMMVFPYVTNVRKGRSVGIAAYLVSGMLLAYASFLQIATLGQLKNRSNFPLLSAAREISLLNFIERIDLLIVFMMMLGIIVKVSIFFYAGLKGIEHVFNRPYRSFVFPFAMIIAFISLILGENFTTYTSIGREILPTYVQTPIYIIFPLLLLLIAFVKGKAKAAKGENQHESF